MHVILAIAPEVFTPDRRSHLKRLALWVSKHPILRVANLRGKWDLGKLIAKTEAADDLAPLMAHAMEFRAEPRNEMASSGRAALESLGIRGDSVVCVDRHSISNIPAQGDVVAPRYLNASCQVQYCFQESSRLYDVVHILDGYGIRGRHNDRSFLNRSVENILMAIVKGIAVGRQSAPQGRPSVVVWHVHAKMSEDGPHSGIDEDFPEFDLRARDWLTAVSRISKYMRRDLQGKSATLRVIVWPRYWHDRYLYFGSPGGLKIALTNSITHVARHGSLVWACSLVPCRRYDGEQAPSDEWIFRLVDKDEIKTTVCSYKAGVTSLKFGERLPDKYPTHCRVQDFQLA